jgi:hypothetical protein
MPSTGFDTAMGFSWFELKEWHKAAFEAYKDMRGAG